MDINYLFCGELTFQTIIILPLFIILLILNIFKSKQIYKARKKFPIRERTPIIIIICQIQGTIAVLIIILYGYLNNENKPEWKYNISYILVPIYNTIDNTLFTIFYLRYFRIYFIFNNHKIKNRILLKLIKNEKGIIWFVTIYVIIVLLLFIFVFNNHNALEDMNKFVQKRNSLPFILESWTKYSILYNLKIWLDLFLLIKFKYLKNNFKINREINVLLIVHLINGWYYNLNFNALKFKCNYINPDFIFIYFSYLIFLLNTTLWNKKDYEYSFPLYNNWIFSDFSMCIFEPKFCKYFDRFLFINYPRIYYSFLDFKKLFLMKSHNNCSILDKELKMYYLYYELYKSTKSYKLLYNEIKNNNTIIGLIYK